jgi:hypothetical protein
MAGKLRGTESLGAFLAGAERSQIIETEDTGGMAVGEINFDGVTSDGLG